MQFFKVKKWLKEQRKPHQLTDQRFSVRFSSSFSPRNENSNLHLELAENPSGLTRLAVFSFLEGSSDILGRPDLSPGARGGGGGRLLPVGGAFLQHGTSTSSGFAD